MSNLMRLLLFQLFLLILFYIILRFQNTLSFGDPDPEAVDLQITIVKGDVSNDSLTLEHDGTGLAHGTMKVKWVIADSSNVKSFFITRKKGSRQVFKFYDTPPWPFYQDEGSATVKYFSPKEKGIVYNYAIHWKDTKGDTYCFDPKIAVKSNTLKDLDLWFYILYLVLVVSSFLLRKKFLYK